MACTHCCLNKHVNTGSLLLLRLHSLQPRNIILVILASIGFDQTYLMHIGQGSISCISRFHYSMQYPNISVHSIFIHLIFKIQPKRQAYILEILIHEIPVCNAQCVLCTDLMYCTFIGTSRFNQNAAFISKNSVEKRSFISNHNLRKHSFTVSKL